MLPEGLTAGVCSLHWLHQDTDTWGNMCSHWRSRADSHARTLTHSLRNTKRLSHTLACLSPLKHPLCCIHAWLLLTPVHSQIITYIYYTHIIHILYITHIIHIYLHIMAHNMPSCTLGEHLCTLCISDGFFLVSVNLIGSTSHLFWTKHSCP